MEQKIVSLEEYKNSKAAPLVQATLSPKAQEYLDWISGNSDKKFVFNKQIQRELESIFDFEDSSPQEIAYMIRSQRDMDKK